MCVESCGLDAAESAEGEFCGAFDAEQSCGVVGEVSAAVSSVGSDGASSEFGVFFECLLASSVVDVDGAVAEESDDVGVDALDGDGCGLVGAEGGEWCGRA